jgi:hypothetical protein
MRAEDSWWRASGTAANPMDEDDTTDDDSGRDGPKDTQETYATAEEDEEVYSL